jgi:hypothetical protein
MTITVLTDVVGFVKSHPEMFFPGARPAPIPCIERLVAEVLALGAPDVAVERRQDWWTVSSSFDWFLTDQSEEEQVRRLIPLPELGPNISRVEVVLIAYAEAVATRGKDGTWKTLSGPGPAGSWGSEPMGNSGRSLAFRFQKS